MIKYKSTAFAIFLLITIACATKRQLINREDFFQLSPDKKHNYVVRTADNELITFHKYKIKQDTLVIYPLKYMFYETVENKICFNDILSIERIENPKKGSILLFFSPLILLISIYFTFFLITKLSGDSLTQ